MNLSEPFIKRPVMTTLVMAAIFFFGLFAYKSLPVSDLPNVDFPTITCSVSYPGTNPETMAATCAVPLEREFMTIDGMQTLYSSSSTGSTSLIMQFDLDKSLDEASTDVQAAINRALPNLPPDLPNNPTYKKINPSQTPIIYLAISSPSMSLSELYDYGNTYIGQRLNMLSGVSQVITFGAPYAARIQVDPEKLAAMGLGINDVVSAIQSGNVDLPTGVLYGPKGEFTVDIDGQLEDAAGYNKLVIRTDKGTLVRVEDIGQALDSLQDDKYSLQYYTKDKKFPCVVLGVQTQAGANTVEVTNEIYNLLPKLKKELPPSLEYHTIYEKKELIMDSLFDMKFTLFLAFILVVAIIFFSLGKFRDTIIPSLAIPLSIAGTFALMYPLGFSVDILSLLALALSVGFLVDDAIVVLENNVRHVHMGKTPMDASIEGSKEISLTILSMTLSLAAVFIPMLFLGGIIGRLFREFAVTIVIAVLFSGFISLTLTPLLSSRFIPPANDDKKNRFEKICDSIQDYLLSIYKKGLLFALNRRLLILGLGISSIFLSFFFLQKLPKDFLPNQDQGFIQGFFQSKDGTSPYLQAIYQNKVAEILRKNPSVESVVSVSSIQGSLSDNQGFCFIKLKPFKERGPMDEVIRTLSQEARDIPGTNLYLSPLPFINLNIGTSTKALYQYSLTGLKLRDLFEAEPKFFREMSSNRAVFSTVSSDLQVKQPQLELSIDRDRASDLGITAQDIENLFNYAYSDNKISTINGEINQYDVIVETLPKFYRDPTVLSSLFLRNKKDQIVPLNQIVKVKESVGPLTVNHLNGLPVATISFNLAKGAPLGEALSVLEKAAESLPRSVTGVLEGSLLIFKESFQDLGYLFIITIFIIYLILGILYESFIHPITVMSALAPATLGGLVTLYLFHETLSIFSFVGFVMLIGIVMKNGIMMVDFANQYIKDGKNAFDAIFEASLVRFRPIMMTTLSTLMGALPIALGVGGATAQTRKGLGLAIVGGLIISQALTLFLTPVIFYYFEILQEKLKDLLKKTPA